MSVWVVWPTINKNNSNQNVERWRGMGYKVAILINPPLKRKNLVADKMLVQQEWGGFAKAVNLLVRAVPGPVVCVAGDDVYPDVNHPPLEIADDFEKKYPDLYGVMQPVGDKFGGTSIAAVSPWIGRAFIDKSYDGVGPYSELYFHYYADAELQDFAKQQKVFYQRHDLTQYHDHWQRKGEKRPSYLTQALARHREDKRRFERRKKAKFPFAVSDLSQQIRGNTASWIEHYNKGPEKGHESVNGLGSWMENTEEIREALAWLFIQLRVCRFVDIPCGDWNWMNHVCMEAIDYTGYDVVPEQIADNRRKYPGINFQVGDLINGRIQRADLVLVRDFLFHIPNDWILRALKTVKSSCSRWLLATTSPGSPNNDIPSLGSVGWRAIDLQAPPFNLPFPEEMIQENDSHACKGRSIGLFDMDLWDG